MDRSAFLTLLRQHLYPVLRAEGFKGSGSTLRRIEGPLIHVFNVQGARRGEGCYLNLGAHLDFLPAEGGLPVSPGAMKEMECAFRGRIEPPCGPAWPWTYDLTPEEAQASVDFIVSEWQRVGRAFFAAHALYPQSYETLLWRDIDASVNHGRGALHMARIAARLGQRERARAWVEHALARASDHATVFKAELAQVLAPEIDGPARHG